MKSCPFCGSDSVSRVRRYYGDYYYCWIECDICGAKTKGFSYKEDVLYKWNADEWRKIFRQEDKKWESRSMTMTEQMNQDAPTGNGWIDAKALTPDDGTDVLAVKELKNGTRSICIARCINRWEYTDPLTHEKKIGPYWVCGGNNNIICWMPLPEMPA